jgi:flagellar motor switch protein FliM
MNHPRPFPYAALPALSREEIACMAQMRQTARTLVRSEQIAGALSELAGEEIAIRLVRMAPLELERIPGDSVGVAVAPADAPGMSRAVVVDVEPALATGLVARALRQRAPRVTDTSRPVPPEIAGALAAVLHAALRRAHAGVPLRIVAAGPGAALVRDLSGVHHRAATAWLAVSIGADAYDARVTAPRSELLGNDRAARLSKDALLAMGDAPLALPLVVATCEVGRAELGSVRMGDALVLPPSAVRFEVEGGELVGPVTIIAPTSERGLSGVLSKGGVLRTGTVEALPWDRATGPDAPHAGAQTEAPMSGELNPTLEILEDAPVIVRVELGAVEMKARQWASLSPGDVITLGRKLGDPAILRVGGVEIARGELVQVDGEYGVRILSRPARSSGMGQ